MSGIASIGNSQAQLIEQVGLKVAAKTLDIARDQGDAQIKLLEEAADLQQQALDGNNRQHNAAGLGARIDVTG